MNQFFNIGLSADHIGNKTGSYIKRNTLAISIWLRDLKTQETTNFFTELIEVADKTDESNRYYISRALDELGLRAMYDADLISAVGDAGMQNGFLFGEEKTK